MSGKPKPRPANDCELVKRLIRGDLTLCGFARCESCADNKAREKK